MGEGAHKERGRLSGHRLELHFHMLVFSHADLRGGSLKVLQMFSDMHEAKSLLKTQDAGGAGSLGCVGILQIFCLTHL